MSYKPHASETLATKADRKAFAASLRKILPADAVLSEPESLRPYECDALAMYTQLPWVVVIPDTISQIQAVMRLCHQTGVPIVARGAGTGLSGGALPLAGGVLLSLARLNQILELDPLNRVARLQPGVRNLAISEAAAPYGLYYAPDPSSQIACTIGGNVAENAGGVHCLKYGLTVHNVIEVRLVTMAGELVTLGASGLDGPGYDLLALVCGSEGLLGVMVEMVVRLLPMPPVAKTLLASFPDIESAGRAVADIIAAGLIPAGLELMDNAIIRATEDFIQAGYPTDAAALLLCEMDGIHEQVAADLATAQRVLHASGASEVRRSGGEAERKRFWAGRKAAFPAVGRIAADYYCMDGTIPRRQLAEVLRLITALSQAHGLSVANVFHAGDGNLHPLILFDASQPGELDRAEALGAAILEACIAAGGTITGEHGVGIEKINQMCLQFQTAELAQFHAVKHAFDPAGLLNPGKAIPTLSRCAEFGAMHVHQGKLPHPQIERF